MNSYTSLKVMVPLGVDMDQQIQEAIDLAEKNINALQNDDLTDAEKAVMLEQLAHNSQAAFDAFKKIHE